MKRLNKRNAKKSVYTYTSGKKNANEHTRTIVYDLKTIANKVNMHRVDKLRRKLQEINLCWTWLVQTRTTEILQVVCHFEGGRICAFWRNWNDRTNYLIIWRNILKDYKVKESISTEPWSLFRKNMLAYKCSTESKCLNWQCQICHWGRFSSFAQQSNDLKGIN